VRLAVSVDSAGTSNGPVGYRWDADTDILIAEFPAAGAGAGPGMTGSVEIEGQDGSWVEIEVRVGRIASIEVAVWPDVKIVSGLEPPRDIVDGVVTVPQRASQPGVAAVEVETSVAGIRRCLAALDASGNGTFLSYDGSVIPW